MHFFEKEQFKERLKDNASVDSLAEVDRIPDKTQIEKDIIFASVQNRPVKKLMIWRNNIIAHKGAKVLLGKKTILKNNPLTHEEIEALLDECFIILNRYSILYSACHWSRKIIGQDDYKYLLNFVRMGLQKWDEDIDKEYQELRKKRRTEIKRDEAT
jgi:hypothetical protein